MRNVLDAIAADRGLGWQAAGGIVLWSRPAPADLEVQAALLARATKAPIQLIWTREEDFAQDRFRPAAAARMQGRVKGILAPAPVK